MLDKMEVYYFSPTGGTKKVSSIFADAMEKEVIWHDLGSKEPMMEKPEGEMTVVASPVLEAVFLQLYEKKSKNSQEPEKRQ